MVVLRTMFRVPTAWSLDSYYVLVSLGLIDGSSDEPLCSEDAAVVQSAVDELGVSDMVAKRAVRAFSALNGLDEASMRTVIVLSPPPGYLAYSNKRIGLLRNGLNPATLLTTLSKTYFPDEDAPLHHENVNLEPQLRALSMELSEGRTAEGLLDRIRNMCKCVALTKDNYMSLVDVTAIISVCLGPNFTKCFERASQFGRGVQLLPVPMGQCLKKNLEEKLKGASDEKKEQILTKFKRKHANSEDESVLALVETVLVKRFSV